jgi:hypothetical protein
MYPPKMYPVFLCAPVGKESTSPVLPIDHALDSIPQMGRVEVDPLIGHPTFFPLRRRYDSNSAAWTG